MGIRSSKAVEVSPTPPTPDEDEICDRTLIIEIADDDLATGKSTDDPKVQSPEDHQTNSSKVARINTFDVCSTKLARKSPFFQKMFSIGMKESSEEVVTLKIGRYEEAAFREMMNYIKSNQVSSKTYIQLLELMMISDRFEVLSCTKSCVDSLLSSPMNLELALLVSNIPKSIAKVGDIRRLTVEANMFISKLKDFKSFPDDLGGINPGVIDCLLRLNDLRLDSEDEAYDFLMKWATSHFSDPKERREFLQEHICNLIHFPYMKTCKIHSFYDSPHMEEEFKNEIKLELEMYEKTKPIPVPQPTKLLYTKRLYKYLPVRTVKSVDDKHGRVFLAMNKNDFKNLAQVKSQSTWNFSIDEQIFYLGLECEYSQEKPSTFGIRLHAGSHMEAETKLQRLMRIKLEVWYYKRSGVFGLRASRVTVLNRRKSTIGCDHLFGVEWETLLSANSRFFISGNMLLKIVIQVV